MRLQIGDYEFIYIQETYETYENEDDFVDID